MLRGLTSMFCDWGNKSVVLNVAKCQFPLTRFQFKFKYHWNSTGSNSLSFYPDILSKLSIKQGKREYYVMMFNLMKIAPRWQISFSIRKNKWYMGSSTMWHVCSSTRQTTLPLHPLKLEHQKQKQAWKILLSSYLCAFLVWAWRSSSWGTCLNFSSSLEILHHHHQPFRHLP